MRVENILFSISVAIGDYTKVLCNISSKFTVSLVHIQHNQISMVGITKCMQEMYYILEVLV